MTRAEQERLVERYLGGLMNSPEEEDFFIQVAVDQDLRQTLKAYRIVESAIRKHRDTAPIHHANSRTRVMAMLNADAVGNRQAGASMARAAKHFNGPIRGMSASSLRWAMGSVAAVALVVGAFVIAPIMQEPQQTADPVRTTPAQRQATTRLQEPADRNAPVAGASSTMPVPREITPLSHDGMVETNVTPETPAPRQMPRTSPERRSELRKVSSDVVKSPSPIARDTATAAAPSQSPEPRDGAPTAAAQTREKNSVPAQSVDSTLKVRVQVKMP